MTTDPSMTYVDINGISYRVPVAVAEVIRNLLDDQVRLINSHQVLHQAVQALRQRLIRLHKDVN